MSESTAGTIRFERRGHVGILWLDRPGRHNAMNEGMWRSLEGALNEVEGALSSTRALVVTGVGERAFCAGFDLDPDNPMVERMAAGVQGGDREAALSFLQGLRGAVDRLVGLPVPTVAAVNGLAYGGGAELAVRCDLRVVDPAAVLCFSEVRLGLMPDWGGGPALTHLVGPGRAADLILTARKVSADELLALGVANRVSAPGQALEEAVELATAIAANGPRAVQSALQVIRRARDLPFTDALEVELQSAATLLASGECVAGVTAFLSRATPDFPDPE